MFAPGLVCNHYKQRFLNPDDEAICSLQADYLILSVEENHHNMKIGVWGFSRHVMLLEETQPGVSSSCFSNSNPKALKP